MIPKSPITSNLRNLSTPATKWGKIPMMKITQKCNSINLGYNLGTVNAIT